MRLSSAGMRGRSAVNSEVGAPSKRRRRDAGAISAQMTQKRRLKRRIGFNVEKAEAHRSLHNARLDRRRAAQQKTREAAKKKVAALPTGLEHGQRRVSWRR